MVTYILRIPYESGPNSYTAHFTLYNYGTVSSFVPPSGYRIPNPEYLFSLEPFLRGEPIDEHTGFIILAQIENEHLRSVTKLSGYELVIKNDFMVKK
jgi:hypothetical protein